MTPLTTPEVDRLFERFSYFGDGVVRRVELELRPKSMCILYCDAMDEMSEFRWVTVRFQCEHVETFCWSSDWRGSIECGELVARFFDGRAYIAVGLDHEHFVSSESFREGNVSMLVIAKTISYDVLSDD
jgi:hypothetical protein